MKSNRKTIIQTSIIIAISIFIGVTNNFSSKKSIPLFQKYDKKLLERKIKENKQKTTNDLQEISAEAVMHLIENNMVIIIDARSHNQFMKGHIPGALNLPVSNLRKTSILDLSLLEKSKIIVIYSSLSSSSVLSELALKYLKKGFKNIFVYKDGIENWMESGYPVEKSV
jgi:rhodanese-related sulfurtransferase